MWRPVSGTLRSPLLMPQSHPRNSQAWSLSASLGCEGHASQLKARFSGCVVRRDASGRRWDNPYLFGKKKGQRTNKWLNVRRGESTRLMPFALVSNTGPSVCPSPSAAATDCRPVLQQQKAGRNAHHVPNVLRDWGEYVNLCV